LVPQAIDTAGLRPTLDDVNFVGTVFSPAFLGSLPVAVPSFNLTKVHMIHLLQQLRGGMLLTMPPTLSVIKPVSPRAGD